MLYTKTNKTRPNLCSQKGKNHVRIYEKGA